MVDISELRVGQKVHYQPEHYVERDEWENGMVKTISLERNNVWVVYNCAGNWNQFMDYTGALTNLRDLNLGWRFK